MLLAYNIQNIGIGTHNIMAKSTNDMNWINLGKIFFIPSYMRNILNNLFHSISSTCVE